MRFRPLVLIALFALPFRVLASERITVDQLQQKLAAPAQLPAAHVDLPLERLQDARLAFQIQQLQLSEQLTRATLQRILATHTFGPQTQNALQLLADRSSLLAPPAAELPAHPAPDANEQQRILEAARAYVFRTLSRLPNFFATRTTSQFYGIPPELNTTAATIDLGLHPRGSWSHEITFRGGKEVIDPMRNPRPAPTLPRSGLETRGEFGPELAVILMDSNNGTMTFHQWEQGATGVLAVFHYSVPQEFSKYEVSDACIGGDSFRARPGYHGSISIDPASGAILRVTLEADWKPEDPISHVASVIEYGPVNIGDRMYICPLRSIALSLEEADLCRGSHERNRVKQMHLNRTIFSDYHRLGSTSRIITDPQPEDEH